MIDERYLAYLAELLVNPDVRFIPSPQEVDEETANIRNGWTEKEAEYKAAEAYKVKPYIVESCREVYH